MARPAQGTPEWDLWIAAIEVATFPPLKRDESKTFFAQVAWTRIDALRAALDKLGVDWRKAKEEGG